MIIITNNQKRVLIYAFSGLMVLVLFWGFVYLPSANEKSLLKEKLNNVNKQLEKIKSIQEVKDAIEKGYVYAESVQKLKNELFSLDELIPYEEEGILKGMSALARKFDIEVVVIRPGNKAPALNSEKIEIHIGNYVCSRLPVLIRLKGYYKNIVKYIEGVGADLNSLVLVDKIRIAKTSKDYMLTADVDISIYLKEKNN